jgi:hypothetical protein
MQERKSAPAEGLSRRDGKFSAFADGERSRRKKGTEMNLKIFITASAALLSKSALSLLTAFGSIEA